MTDKEAVLEYIDPDWDCHFHSADAAWKFYDEAERRQAVKDLGLKWEDVNGEWTT